MKPVRDYGSVERRPNNKFRVRIGKKHGGITLGTFDSKLEAEEALANWKIKENITAERYKNISNEPDQKPWAEIGLDGGEIATGTLTAPLLVSDWDAVLKSFGLDPAIFQVADDKVRMSKWQSSKRLENGDRDLIWLYSYRATFTRRKMAKIDDLDIESIRKNIRTFKPLKTASKGILQDPSTFVFLAADWQLGKSSAGGPEATT
jgi:hypothetical protein